jgi:hypothetical protein
MHLRRTAIGVAAITGMAAALSGGGTALAVASSGSSGARVGTVASGLNGPIGLGKLGRKSFVVAEQGASRVLLIGKHGGKKVIVSQAGGVSGVVGRGRKVFSVIGGPDENGNPPQGKYAATSVLRTNLRTGRTVPIANLQTYELQHNPDGQKQFGPGHTPYDALSNPFTITSYPRGLLVADGGANDVLRVNPRTGKVSTFFVPPTVKASESSVCGTPQGQANPGTVGCDPVPTGVVFARGSVWVLTLGAFAPGGGHIYKLNARTGKIQRVIKGLTAPVGLAVDHDSIYVGEPNGPGDVLRIHRGKRTHVSVPSPTSLVTRNGALFATSGVFGPPGTGKILRITDGSFK